MEHKQYFSFKHFYGLQEKGDHLLYLPVCISPGTLPDELEMLLSSVTKGNFISYKNVSLVQMLIWLITEKLEAYYQVCPEEARMAGEKMISILESLETDDDTFPEYDIGRIHAIVKL